MTKSMKPPVRTVVSAFNHHLGIAALFLSLIYSSSTNRAEVVTYPAPQGEALSSDYVVEADGKPIPAYQVK
jgi:hypothetical protein